MESVSIRPLITGLIKSVPEDFVVEELPAYEPSGQGDHLYIRFTKRGFTTEQAITQIAAALEVDPRACGMAGMKDKHAVTTQTISAPLTGGAGGQGGNANADRIIDRAKALSLPSIEVHEVNRHSNKLKPGHLRGNRFAIRVREIPKGAIPDVLARLERIRLEGVPNEFGEQRFGRDGDNVERARAWLSGAAKPPRDPRLRRLHWSSVQSAIFNEVLRQRVQDRTWTVPQEGDLLKHRYSGGMFVCKDVQVDRERANTGEISPTGPIAGDKMRRPEGAIDELEQRVIAEFLGSSISLAQTRALGEGTRRALRLSVEEMRVEVESGEDPREQVGTIRVYFVLPKGAYATTVLGSAVTLVDPGGRPQQRQHSLGTGHAESSGLSGRSEEQSEET